MIKYTKWLFVLLFAIDFTSVLAQAPVINLFSPQSNTAIKLTGANFVASITNSKVYFGAVNNSTPFTNQSFANKIDVISGSSVYGVVVKDFNGDGKADLAVVNSGSNDISVFKNNSTPGSASFDTPLKYAVNGYSVGITAGDLDGDNKPDLVVTNFNANTVTIFKNTSTANQISFEKELVLNTGAGPYNVAIADLDADGKPDIVVTNDKDFPGSISILKNNSSPGTFSFAVKKDFTVTSDPRGLSIGDLDADSKPDIVVACQDGKISVLKNTSTPGNINFDTDITYQMATDCSPESVIIADLDGDAKSDIAIANNNSTGTISVLQNTSQPGTISFAGRKDFSVGANPFSIASADINGDGKPDLAVTNQLSDNVSVLINSSTTGNIDFNPVVNFGTGTQPRSIAITDVDGNGVPDLVVGNNGTNTVSILLAANTSKLPSVITLPPQLPVLDANNNYDPKATSTNHDTPVTYTSSNPAVATITPDGLVHVIAPGVTIITANQLGNEKYDDAAPVSQTLTVVEYLYLNMPPIASKIICQADFPVNVTSSNSAILITYASSNPNVATISSQGIIHIVGAGTTTITATQNASPPLYVSATPVSQTFTVTVSPAPTVDVTAIYAGQCEGSAIKFTASGTNAGTNPTYQWQVNGVNAGTNNPVFVSNLLKNYDRVTCTLSNNDAICQDIGPATSDPVIVTLTSPSAPSVIIKASNNDVFAGTPITFTATTMDASGTITYQWQVNGINAGLNSNIFTSNTLANGDLVACAISTSASCSTPAVSQLLTVDIVNNLTIPNSFTPNGDGINDTWVISGITSYPNSVIRIFTRYGTLVYQQRNYSNNWGGLLNGHPLPVATYYYVIDLGFKSTKRSGWVAIIR
jgi:gliding motility-associated-like protein